MPATTTNGLTRASRSGRSVGIETAVNRGRSIQRRLLRRGAAIIAIVGSMVGGYAGWWAGAFAGVMTAFFLSVVGTGLGVYAGRRMAQHFGV